MRTLITLIGLGTLLLINPSKANNFSKVDVLVNGDAKTSFDQIASATNKPKMVLFYSSQNCAPCIKQLEDLKANLDHLDNNYQLIFIDSWTLGKAKKGQETKIAQEFYQSNLQTDHSTLLLDPEDQLLLSYQTGQEYKYALPFMVIHDQKGNEVSSTYNLMEVVDKQSL